MINNHGSYDSGARGGASDNFIGGGLGGGYDPSAPYNPYEKLDMPELPKLGMDISSMGFHEPSEGLEDILPPPLPGSENQGHNSAIRSIIGGAIVGLVIGYVFLT